MKSSSETHRVFKAFDDILSIVFRQFGLPHFLQGRALARMERNGPRETQEFMIRVAARGIRGVLDPDEMEYIRNAIEAHRPSGAERETYERLISKVRRLGLAHATQ